MGVALLGVSFSSFIGATVGNSTGYVATFREVGLYPTITFERCCYTGRYRRQGRGGKGAMGPWGVGEQGTESRFRRLSLSGQKVPAPGG